MELDIQQIKKIIPHRFPFLMIDKVLEVKPNEKLVALKNVTYNENFFLGHFPNEKVMPGVLITEAMAQAGCIYFYYSKGYHKKKDKNLIYYLGKVTVKFSAPVIPGDQLVIEVRTRKLLPKSGVIKTQATVGEKKVAEAEILFSVKEV